MRPGVVVVGSYAVGLSIVSDALPAPGQTVLGRGFAMGPGGKGSNQAIGAARLGAHVAFVARLGDDAFADAAVDLYAREGVDAGAVRRTPGVSTGAGIILIDARGQNRIVVDPGANALLTPADVEAALDALRARMRIRVVLAQLEIPLETALAAMRAGRQLGALTILNPAPAQPLSPGALAHVDVVTPNESEARVALGLAPDAEADEAQLAEELRRWGARWAVVTLGGRGALLADERGVRRFPAERVPVVDATGAGDAFNAALAVALAEGCPLDDAIAWANKAGAHCVQRAGVVPGLPRREEMPPLACSGMEGG